MQLPSMGELPSSYASEKKIKEKAPEALRFIEESNALDLLEMLGLDHLYQPKESH